MHAIRSLAQVGFVPDRAMRELLRRRLAEVAEMFGEHDAEKYGWFLVLEEGDDPDDREQLGTTFSLVRSPWNGIQYGEVGFLPPFEWVCDHGFCYEALAVIADAGDFVSVLVPKGAGIEQRLIDLCASLAFSEP